MSMASALCPPAGPAGSASGPGRLRQRIRRVVRIGDREGNDGLLAGGALGDRDDVEVEVARLIGLQLAKAGVHYVDGRDGRAGRVAARAESVRQLRTPGVQREPGGRRAALEGRPIVAGRT